MHLLKIFTGLATHIIRCTLGESSQNRAARNSCILSAYHGFESEVLLEDWAEIKKIYICINKTAGNYSSSLRDPPIPPPPPPNTTPLSKKRIYLKQWQNGHFITPRHESVSTLMKYKSPVAKISPIHLWQQFHACKHHSSWVNISI